VLLLEHEWRLRERLACGESPQCAAFRSSLRLNRPEGVVRVVHPLRAARLCLPSPKPARRSTGCLFSDPPQLRVGSPVESGRPDGSPNCVASCSANTNGESARAGVPAIPLDHRNPFRGQTWGEAHCPRSGADRRDPCHDGTSQHLFEQGGSARSTHPAVGRVTRLVCEPQGGEGTAASFLGVGGLRAERERLRAEPLPCFSGRGTGRERRRPRLRSTR
jgi:hypothetical protein